MSAVQLAKLERITNFARGIVAPLAEAWSESVGATVLIGSPQAEELRASELAETLDGWFWVLPVEMTGVRSGSLSFLIDQSLVVAPGAGPGPSDEGPAGRFAGVIDEFLVRAADRLTASAGGPVALDRLGLREVPGDQAAGILSEFLGPGELVAVSLTAEMTSGAAGDASRTGEVGVVFGGKLARDLAGSHSAGADTVAGLPTRAGSVGTSRDARAAARGPSPGAGRSDAAALLQRARGLRLRLSAEIGRKTLTVGDVLALRRGSAIDLSISVTAPLGLWAGAKRIALGDTVVLPGRFGFRLRA